MLKLPSSRMEEDLARSGLTPADIDAYPANETHLAASNLLTMAQDALDGRVGAYVIPYFDPFGKRLPYYRIRIIDEEALDRKRVQKYRQPKGTSNHVYFPKSFGPTLRKIQSGEETPAKINGFSVPLLIVEGEKKAARIAKEGYLAVGLGGVYSWQTRTIQLPPDIKVERDSTTGSTRITLPGEVSSVTDTPLYDSEDEFSAFASMAPGMAELIDLTRIHNLTVVIAFDADYPDNPKVQKAAASLAFALRNRGIPATNIRQLMLPAAEAKEKLGVDDFLEHPNYGPDKLREMLHDLLAKKGGFPKHPNVQLLVTQRLRLPMIGRDQLKELAALLISDLDAAGIRAQDVNNGQPYYFDNTTKELMPVDLMTSGTNPLHMTDFGRYLYQKYAISGADRHLIPWLAAAFTGEEPLERVQPRSVLHIDADAICLQINGGQYIRVTGNPKKPWELCDNGTNGILFRRDAVEHLPSEHITKQLNRLEATHRKNPPNWWRNTLSQFKFVKPSDLDLISTLFYMSPWLLRWQGTQLPFEMAIGEPGSGKSSMYTLRQRILTGFPLLRNMPSDIRDWYASITSAGYLHVTDNVHFAVKDMKQRLSDEICRIVTEPVPFIELRKLYTTSENIRMPVETVFAITAIQQPFVNADILQRSVIFELEAVGGDHDSDWVGHQLSSRGGRASWIAHHLWVIHGFLRRANHEGKWDKSYKSKHRLANFEQSVLLMCDVLATNVKTEDLKAKSVGHAIIDNLNSATHEHIADHDWGMQGLRAFAEEWYQSHANGSSIKPFYSSTISDWAISSEDYSENPVLNNARRLGRYLKSHKTSIYAITGIQEAGKTGNVVKYSLDPIQYAKAVGSHSTMH